MAITSSLNLVQQNTNLLDELKEYFEKQINPLANAGQRFGIASNGIAYKSFSINDIFDNAYSGDKYIAELKYTNSNMLKISLVDKETYTESNEAYQLNDISSILYLSDSSDIVNLISYVINNIEEYQKDSLLINEDGLLTCILKGKYVDTDVSEDGEIFYFQYDIVNNRLMHFIDTKPFDSYINEKNNWYILYKVDYVEDGKYSLSVHLFTLASIAKLIANAFDISDSENDLITYLKNIYKYDVTIFDKDNTDEHVIRSFSPFNYMYKDYDLMISNQTTNNFGDVNLFQILLNYNPDNYDVFFNEKIDIIHCENMIINYNDHNESVSFTLDKSAGEYKKIIGYISYEDLNEFLYILSNINFLYIKLLNHYNKLIYNKDKNTLFKRIFISLFNKIREESTLSSNDKLYVPLDYKIHYVCNNNDLLDIYYSNNIYVTCFNTTLFKETPINDMIIYYNPNCVNHSIIYNFEFDYNKTYTDIITDLRIVKLYSLPYINSLNNWVINDVDTNITSINDVNTGIKTIFIYTDDDEYNILNISNLVNENNASILNKFSCEKRSFIVNPKLFSNYSNYTISCNAWIPTITDYNQSFFEQTLIISISSKNSFNYKEYGEDYNIDYVYSLWVLTTKNNKLQFEYITDLYSDNDYAYDPFNNTAFLQYVNNETNKISALLVPSQNYKQNSSNLGDAFWMVQRNKAASNYNVTGYNNDYNAIIEYVGKLNKSGNNPTYPSNKFISELSNIQITNVIYPKLKIEREVIETVEEFKSKVKSIQSEFKLYDIIVINGQTITSSSTLEEVINTVSTIQTNRLTTSMIVETARVSYDNNVYYNEYVFNSNVPTIDLKEVFVRNVNVLNRTNIISISPDAKVYNGYIGSSFTNNDKSVMHISGSASNINLGTDTLINVNQLNKFNPYTELSLDNFNNIQINPLSQIKLSKNPLIYKSSNEYIFSVIPFGLVDSSKLPIKLNPTNNKLAFSDKYISNQLLANKNIIFVRFYMTYYNVDIDTRSTAYLFDALYLNNIIYNNTGEDIGSYDLSNFKKNNNIIFMMTKYSKNMFFLKLNSNEIEYSDNAIITQSYNHSLIISKYLDAIGNMIFNISFDDSIINNGTPVNWIDSISDNNGVNIINAINEIMENMNSSSNYNKDLYTTDNATFQGISINVQI